MLKIRLQRIGRRNHPEFRVVVTESTRGPKSANNVEVLGSYNPHTNTKTVNAERAKYWMGVGAQVSGTVHNILIDENVIEGKKVNVLPRKNPIVKEEEKAEEPAQEESSEESSEEDAPVEEEKKEEAAAA